MMLWINLLGLLLIALIVWWFWLYKPQEVLSEPGLTVRIENGVYNPARLKVPANAAFTLQFLRKDASPCAEVVVFPELDISETLPLAQAKDVLLPALQPGTYHFHCQMQMYRGELLVE